MAPRSTAVVGDRISVARRRRGMSRRALAAVIGRSEEWLRKIENGQRQLDSIEYAVRLGRALNIDDIMGLLGFEDHASRPPNMEAGAISLVREALMDSVVVQALRQQPPWDEAEQTIEQDVAEARRRWFGTVDRYHRTLELLPRLLCGAASRLHAIRGGEAVRPALAAYHLARTVLSRLGEEQLARIAADRALSAAQHTAGPPLLASAWHVSDCYLRQGCLPETHRFALAADAQHARQEETETWAISGALRLLGAEAAAAMLETHRAYALLDDVRRTAALVGDTFSPYLVPFGPTEVSIGAVQIAIRLGQTGKAIRLASEIDLPDDYPADLHARHYIPLALLYSRRNEDAAAVFALTKMAAISPEDIRYDPLSREALSRLLRRNNLTVRRELTRLGRIAGMT